MTVKVSEDYIASIFNVGNVFSCKAENIYRMFQEDRSVFGEVIVPVILSKKRKVYMYIRRILNGFRDRATSLYSCKIVDKKEILRTVSNTGIYCSSDRVGSVYLV
jgi:hypothetical protein